MDFFQGGVGRLKKTHNDPSKLFQRFRAKTPPWLGAGVAEFGFVVRYHGPETAKKGRPATFFFDHRPSVIDEGLSKSVARYIAFLESGGETEYTRLFIKRWNDVVKAARDPPEITAEEREEKVREFLRSNSCIVRRRCFSFVRVMEILPCVCTCHIIRCNELSQSNSR
ncbi:MAG: hypothetical protein GY740_18410 [Gammaproteobacteria bacterium]|nr:hypothetical protein [Gammaproteobacteria bacterium]